MGIVLLGALGFAIDGSQLFAQRRMAQAVADAAAQAAIMSIFDGTNTAGSSHYFDTSTGVHTCGSSDPTPCHYAQTFNGFSGTTCPATAGNDCVSWEPNPADFTAPNLSSVDNPNRIRVTVSRAVPTTLMRFLGTSTATVSARGTAAIITAHPSAPQIIVAEDVRNAFTLGSGASLTVTGGANRVIEVNSSQVRAVRDRGGTIDLSAAGEAGNGADFGVWGGPDVATFLRGGTYVQPGSPITPIGVSPPMAPPSSPNPIVVPSGVPPCPGSVGPGASCLVYAPGQYTSDINLATGQVAVFEPGIYNLQEANFIAANAYIVTASSPADPTTGTGILLFANSVQLSGNSSLSLRGSIITGTFSVLSGNVSISFPSDSPTPAYYVRQVALVN